MNSSKIEVFLLRSYSFFRKQSFIHKPLTIAIFMLMIPAGYLLYSFTEKDIFPEIETQSMSIQTNHPLSFMDTRMVKQLQKLTNEVSDNNLNVNILAGIQGFVSNSPQPVLMQNSLMHFSWNNAFPECIKNTLLNRVSNYFPHSGIKIIEVLTPFNAVFKQDRELLLLRLKGSSVSNEKQMFLKKLAARNLIKESHRPGDSFKEGYKIRIKREMLALNKLDYSSFIRQLDFQMRGSFINTSDREKNSSIRIISRDDGLYQKIQNGYVHNYDGIIFSIKPFIELAKIKEPYVVHSDKNGSFIEIPIDVDLDNIAIVDKEIRELAYESGLEIEFAGNFQKILKWNSELIVILIISIILLYFLLAAQFESLWLPVIILLEVLIDLTGVFFFLIVFNESLNVMSGIGIIVMAGIIINDSILKMDIIIRLKKGGIDILEAVIEGGKQRFFPILLTSLTTILAVLPTLFTDGLGASLQRPLAVAIIGGLTLGTFVSLYFLPLCYLVLHNWLSRIQGFINYARIR